MSLVPDGLRQAVLDDPGPGGAPSGEAWLRALPRVAEELLGHWALVRDGAPRHGVTALVLPVVQDDQGMPAALKIVRPHPEARQEHKALGVWAGRAAVRLLAADPARWALLLERLDPDRDLDGLGVLDSAEELGRLLRALDRPAPPWAPRLSDRLTALVEQAGAALSDPRAGRWLPRRMLQRARSLAADLATETGTDARLVHTDLHGRNVLWRPDPGEWVAIDPKVMAADPAYAVAPALWNRWGDALGAHDLRVQLTLRMDVLCDAAGIDGDRARALTTIRLVGNVLDALEHGPDRSRRSWVERAVPIVKAMEPG